ncbi:probable disease resistance protein At5g63020 [Vitis riparia]|uniref:probable disease resistance protein At5g63020 n=1 Tax=Vitis riparia TaxID=96939 RepID=UPI00155A2E75|nr:probable disease resistance protein At5g63020 [Vitis riparia]
MDFVSPVLDIASCLWDCTAKRAVYIRKLPENLNSLRTAMDDLKNVYEDVKEKVDREERLRKKRTRAVDGWIQKVEAMEKEVNDLLAKGEEEIQQKCLGTCCPQNCHASYKIGKMVRGKMDEVTLQKTEGLNFSVVAEPLPSPTVIERPLDKMVGLDSLFDHVCMQLQDDKVGSVGLYGMGGVGKTTLLTRINNESLKTRDEFDAVIWVTVSRPATVEKVQEVVFNKLEIPKDKWEGRSEDERKEAIFNVLKTKKFLLLLDDIWEPLDLFAVGIPPVNDGSKSKVVFTTRFSTVCRDMGAKKSIEVKCLAWEEAFALFQKYVGEDTINSHPHIPKLAEIVAKECDGLPLALITIGRAMAGAKTPEEWEKKIPMLKKYPAKFPGMENHLFPRLAFSYDSLQDEATKSCFLYCSLFPEDYEINCNDLVQLWIGEGLLDEYGDIKEAKNRGEEIIASLKHACLLESGTTARWSAATYVKMHDVIRDMALWLACQNGNKKQNKFAFIDKEELVKAHEVEKWKEMKRISLFCGSFDELMEPPSFPNLQTLLVSNLWKKSFPRGFFTYMPIITVLDLSFHRQMIDLPMEIGKLSTLQYLNLSHTGIETIPMELRNLTKLRCLILDGISELEIPSQTISGLSSLQLFSMMYFRDSQRDCRVLLEELEGLKYIEQISISPGSVPSILKLLNSHKLQRCVTHFTLQWCEDMNLLHLLLPYLEMFNATACSNLEDVTVNLEKEVVHSTFPRHRYLYHLSEVTIVNCEKLKKLTCLIYAPNLKLLNILDCASLEEVIQVGECGVSEIESDLGLFSRLALVYLRSLPKLRSICKWSLLFPSLRVMNVVRCPNLRKLPFDSNIKISKNLEEIKGEQEWWAELEWEDQTIKHNLTPYFKPQD